MHIAFLTPEFPHPKTLNSGGLGTSIKNLAAALVKNGEQVSVFVYGQDSDEIIEENALKIHLIKQKKYTLATWYFYRKHLQNYLLNTISKENIDIIEAPDWTGIIAFMKFKIPLIIRFHGSDTYFCHLEKRKQKLKNYWFEKLAINGAKAFIAPTTFAGDLSKKLFHINNKKIETIPYGLELENFFNDKPYSFTKGLILYIGTIIRKKGVFELPDIFKKVRLNYPNAKLLVIGNDAHDIQSGDASTWELVKNEFNKNDLKNVEYLGKISYQEVQEYIKKANVCIFPTYAETLGMVTIESMAMNKVVVNSNLGWATELIDDSLNGYLVHPSNHDLFASRILELLNDGKLYSTMAKNARLKVEANFDIHKLVQKNLDFYKKMLQ